MVGDWASLYWPQIVSAAFSVVASVVGGILLYLFRPLIQEWRTGQAAIREDTRQTRIDASQSAEDVSHVRNGQDDIVRRLAAVEAGFEAMKDGVSTDLAERALLDVRFRGLEQRLRQIENRKGTP